jgi:hypothetical protein
MKNIYLIPTEKPSRLYKSKITQNIFISNIISQHGDATYNQHLYITSDEEIKEGDWCINTVESIILTLDKETKKAIPFESIKKIILTTDQDLINDGVQAIDDEFLEWFVKNPSCERVEVENEWEGNGTMFGFKMGNVSPDGTWRYQIIIPREEPKQEDEIIDISDHDGIGNAVDNLNNEEPKQETLEEAAEKYVEEDNNNRYYNDFIAGAKWQAERMYSEEEVIAIVEKSRETGLTAEFLLLTEQFKKK